MNGSMSPGTSGRLPMARCRSCDDPVPAWVRYCPRCEEERCSTPTKAEWSMIFAMFACAITWVVLILNISRWLRRS